MKCAHCGATSWLTKYPYGYGCIDNAGCEKRAIAKSARKETLLEARKAVILALMDGKSVVLAIDRLIGELE